MDRVLRSAADISDNAWILPLRGLPLAFLVITIGLVASLRGRRRLELGVPILALVTVVILLSRLAKEGTSNLGEAVASGAQKISRSVSGQLIGEKLAFGPFEWIVVSLLLLSLLRAWFTAVRACIEWPVEIAEFKNASNEESLDSESVMTLMRSRLADIGVLPAPPVPEDTEQTDGPYGPWVDTRYDTLFQDNPCFNTVLLSATSFDVEHSSGSC